MGEIGSHRSEELELGGSGISVRCNNDNTTLNGRTAIGHGRPGGDAGGNLEGEETFAAAVIAVEDGDA